MPQSRSIAVRENTGEIVQFDPALIDAPVTGEVEPDGLADFGDVEGHHPSVPIKAALKEHEGETILVTQVEFVPTPPQFLEEKRAKGLTTTGESAVLRYRGSDGRYYLSVAGNTRVLGEANVIRRMLERVVAVRCKVEAYTSTGGKGWHLAGADR